MLRLATKFRPEQAAFEQAEAAGFRCAEFYLDASVLDQADEVIQRAQSFDMRYALHFPNRPELTDHHLQTVARMYDELQASAVVIHPPMLRRYGDAMRAIHPQLALAEETMRIAPDEFIAWILSHDHVTLDVEHIWKFTILDGPVDHLFDLVRRTFDEAGDRVRHIHMPGYLPGQGEHRPMYTSREFCMGIFDILADHQFDGLVVSETNVPFQNPFELKMDVLLYDYWYQQRQAGQGTQAPAGLLSSGERTSGA